MFTFLIANWRYVVMGLLVVALGVQTHRLDDLQTEYATHLEADATATAQAVAQAKVLGERVASAVNDVSAAYERGKEDAKQTATTVATQLNAGTVRVRTIWKCPAVSGNVPENAGPPSEPSAAEQERNASAGRIVGAARSCDAQVAALIDAYNAAKKTINGE